MNVKNIERNGNEATIVVEIDKDLMETGINKAYLKARKQISLVTNRSAEPLHFGL